MVKKTLRKLVTVRKLFKNAIKCRQAENCSSICLDFRAERVKEFTLNYADEIDNKAVYTGRSRVQVGRGSDDKVLPKHLGRSSNAKTARNAEKANEDQPTYRPIDG